MSSSGVGRVESGRPLISPSQQKRCGDEDQRDDEQNGGDGVHLGGDASPHHGPYLDREGVPHEKTPAELEIHYRHVPALEKNFAVSAVFRGEKSSTEEIVRRLEASQEKRRTTQPIAKSAGCIFKNPTACPAGKLVDELGLKGARVGDARVSEVHGNFIVNEGAATADQVLELIGQIQAVARKERGIELETEVQIVGEELTR